MPAPSQLAISTGAVSRLLKEESSYHKEFEQQQKRIADLEKQDMSADNAEFQLKQEKKALAETEAIFPSIRQRIMAAAAQLESRLKDVKEDTNADEVERAKEALQKAKSLSD